MGNKGDLTLGNSHCMHPIFPVFEYLLEAMGGVLFRHFNISKKELQEECYRMTGQQFKSKAEFIVAFEAFFELYKTLVAN